MSFQPLIEPEELCVAGRDHVNRDRWGVLRPADLLGRFASEFERDIERDTENSDRDDVLRA